SGDAASPGTSPRRRSFCRGDGDGGDRIEGFPHPLLMNHLKSLIREVPDFPKPGILFYDITTLLKDPEGLRSVIDALGGPTALDGVEKVVGIEARGFIFAPAVADALKA